MKSNIDFYYDEELQCLVKRVKDFDECRMQLDMHQLLVLQSRLKQIIKENPVMAKLSYKQAEKRIQELQIEIKNTIKEKEAEIVELALQHNIPVYLGEYGIDGRELLLEDNPWTDKKRGEWLYSSETC